MDQSVSFFRSYDGFPDGDRCGPVHCVDDHSGSGGHFGTTESDRARSRDQSALCICGDIHILLGFDGRSVANCDRSCCSGDKHSDRSRYHCISGRSSGSRREHIDELLTVYRLDVHVSIRTGE